MKNVNPKGNMNRLFKDKTILNKNQTVEKYYFKYCLTPKFTGEFI